MAARITLPLFRAGCLDERIDPTLVLPSARGTPPSPSNLRWLLRQQCELAGIRPATLQTLRHSAATLLRAQGVPSPEILDVLGHQDVRMLRCYQHMPTRSARTQLPHRPELD
jgi:integrase